MTGIRRARYSGDWGGGAGRGEEETKRVAEEKFYCDKCAALFYGPPIIDRLPVGIVNRQRTTRLKCNLLPLRAG